MPEMTHAALYDQLQEWFGIGDYDEGAGQPWYKARMTEIGKLKRLMRSRHVDIETLLAAASYAHDRHEPIVATWQLIDLIPDARRAAREAAVSGGVAQELAEAVQDAVAAGEDAWAVRLAAASGREALDAWVESRVESRESR